jgi:DNA-binding XRE family transcriptional regulator
VWDYHPSIITRSLGYLAPIGVLEQCLCYLSSVDLSAAAWQYRPAVEPRSRNHVALGQAIRELRLTAGFSQEAFADRCGMHRTYVGGIERGERNLSFANLLRVAGALGVRPSELLVRYERRALDVDARDARD